MGVCSGLVLWSLLAYGEPAGEPVEPSEEAQAETSVVFMSVPEVDPQLEREAVEAMQAQLMGISTRLVVRDGQVDETMRGRIDRALALAAEESATAVFWIEVDDSGQILHYTVEAGRGDRALVRRTGTDAGSRSAQLEAVAVITRRSTDALLRGGEIGVGFEEVRPEPPRDPEPEPVVTPPAPATPERQRGTFRFALAYSGTTYAPEHVWQSGMNLRAGWRFPFGLLIDVGYTLNVPARRSIDGVELTVARHPIELGVGYRRAWQWLAIEAELAGIADVNTRRTLSAEPGFLTTEDDARLVLGFAPRVRLEWLATRVLRVFVSAAMPVYPTAFAYVGDLPERTAFFRPWRLRGQTRLGITFSI